jgi:TolB-like protein/Tfp pilus assembly protein PilF
MPLSSGDKLGKYEILCPIGAGGMGEVFRARDPRLGRDVAVKVLSVGLAHDPDHLARFQREARAVAALNHPHIVTIFSVEEAEGIHFLTMELVEGQPLGRLIGANGLPAEQIVEIAGELADALAAAHEKGIIHRDLKPANVMITRDGRVKVLDFGLAKDISEGGMNGATVTSLGNTQAGVMMGTPAYMSPEQISCRPLDHRTDIFSLGVVLYEMATGKQPFKGNSSAELISAILRDHPAPVTESRPELPSDLARIIRRCLEKEPRHRIQTARDVANEFRDLARPRPHPIEPHIRAEAAAASPTPAPSTPSHTVSGVDSGKPREDEGFWVAVLPFKAQGASAELAALADGLSEEIVTGLSRFSYLRVIARSSTSRFAHAAVDIRSAGKELGARYVMEGSLRHAGSKLRLSVQLVDAVTGAHLWAENYERTFSPEMLFDLQDDLVPRIVSTVADAYGVLPHAMSQTVRSKAVAELTPYEALLRSFSYAERVTAEEHAQAKAALERAVEQHPGSTDCWAMLSILLTDEFIHGLGNSPDPLSRALQAARHAVDAGPGNHKAHLALAWALFFCKEFQASRVAAERTLSLNSMDASACVYVGQIIAFAGVLDEEWQRGCELITRAIELNPNHPGWYWYAPFLDSYRKQDYNSALDIAFKINMPGFTLAYVAVAAAHGQLGNQESAANAVRQILSVKPDYATVARRDLEKIWAPQLVEHLIEGLRKAGLQMEKAEKPQNAPSSAQSGALPAALSPSIAVLPFANLSAEKDQEYFSDGLAEEIINLLAQISGLKVIARTSAFAFRGKEEDIRGIAEALGVTSVLQGSVRRAGSRIRVTVQLINAADGAHLWSERYDREMADVFAVQDEIAAAIAGKLKVKLSTSPQRYVPQLPAYEELLKARHHLQRWSPEMAVRGRECLEKAIALDPGFALAHSDLGWCHYILAIENQVAPPEAADAMRARARKALEIEPSLPDAHAVLAMAAVLDYDWPEAGRQFPLAMASGQIQPLIRYLRSAFYLCSLGRMREAEEELERTIQEEPLNAAYRAHLGGCLLATGRYAEGEALLRDVLQLDENFWIGQSWLSLACLKQNRVTEAIACEAKALSLAPWNPTVIGRLAAMHERVGEKSRAQAVLKELGEGTAFGTAGGLVCYHLILADIDSAADWYEKAIEQRDPRAPWLFPMQFGDLLTASPRWPGLLKKMNLPAAGSA